MAVTVEMRTEVSQLYVALFGRAPDAEGLGFWTQALADGASMTDIANSMYATDPARSYYPLFLTNAEIVTSFYVNVLGRAPDAEGLAYWTAKLNAPGATPGSVIVDIIDVVANYTGTDPDGLESAALFANKVEAAQWYGENGGGVANASHFLSTITVDHSTVDDAIAAGVDPVPVFHVTPDSASVDEGATVHFNISTEHVLPGAEYAYTISGVSAADVVGGSLSGTVIIDAEGKAVIERTLVADATTEGLETLSVTIDGVTGSVNVNDTSTTPISLTYILTTDADDLTGTIGDDTFKATQDTLQLGDSIDGAGGSDRLELSISGSGITLAGFASDSVETISVKSLSTNASTLDLSDTQGVTTIESIETEGASLTFRDIQSVEDTNIRIVDTDETHNFTYDANAYPGSGTVEIELQEIRGAEINFGDVGEDLGSSEIDQIDITSSIRTAGQVNPATTNVVSDLNVGDALEIVNITGDADLTVQDALDENIRLVNAGTLAANLTLDMTESNDVDVDEVTYIGAMGDDVIDFGNTSNDKDVTLGTGNDWVNTGTGEASVDGGAGNDTIFTGAQNDLVFGGDGNDTVFDDGAVGGPGRYFSGGNYFDLGAGNDYLEVDGAANNTVVAGTGNDVVTLNGAGNNTVNLGDGDDTLTVNGNGNNTVDAGTGNDSVTLNASGTQNVTLGDGSDFLEVDGNGNVNATGGTGDDWIQIYGDGIHTIDLGAGNDSLYIAGEGDIGLITTILGGEGNDSVEITEDHRLNADLGAGDDSITLRARDLENDDTVAGNAGQDTMILTNISGNPQNGRLGESETQRTTGFEFFDLRDGGIELHLTDNLIESAEDNSVTVITESAVDTQTVDMTAVTAPDYSFTLRGGDAQDIVIVDDATMNSFSTLRFDNAANGIPDSTEDTLRIVGSATVTYGDLRNVSGLEIIELGGTTTWNIELNAATISQTTGNADLVIRIDPHVPAGSVLNLTIDPELLDTADSNVRIIRNSNVFVYVNGDLVTQPEFGTELLAFNGSYGLYVETALHFTDGPDTLVGTPFADLFTADSVNELNNADFADGMGNYWWGLDTLRLDFAVANPTDSLSEQLNDARIQGIERIEFNTGNNVSMDGLNDGPWWMGLDVGDLQELATGNGNDTLYNMGGDILYQLNGGDDLITVLPWWAGSPTIDGGLGIDTVETTSFWWGEDDHSFSIVNVEIVSDDDASDDDQVTILSGLPGSSQAPGGLVSFWNIENIYGSSDADNIFADSNGGSITLYGNGGDDTLVVGGGSPSYVYVDGGDGNDTITVTADDWQNWSADPSATVLGGNGDDVINVTVTASSNWWWWWGSNDASATVDGGDGNDSITVNVGASSWWWWNGSIGSSATASVTGGNGDDTINVDVHSQLWDANWWGDSVASATVDGGNGNDVIDVSVSANNSYGWWTSDADASATVTGGAGNDTITVDVGSSDTGYWWWGSDGDATASATVDGGDGNDTIDVHVSSNAYAYWLADTAAASSATVTGGAGDDDISVVVEAHRNYWWGSSANGTADATVDGGSGNDSIYVDALISTITGGAGNDAIDLAVRSDAGADTLVFGTIDYDALQQVLADTQGTDTITGFNFEAGGAGAEDQMDFSAFLGTVNLLNGGQPEYADWRAGTTTLDMTANGSNVAVIEANAGFTLTAANISQQENPTAGTLQIGGTTAPGAEGRTVVIVASDTNGTLGFDHFDVYYVQDVDQDTGAAWQVDLVGQITSATEIGAITSVDAANIVT